MTTVIDLACLAQAVYDFGKPVPGPWQAGATRSAWQGFLADGLQAGLYVNGSQSVIAFRGTNISWRLMSMLQDFGADVWLTLGMNSSYFAAATAFTLEQARKHPNLVLCGHSLGGAVSQVVGNRLKLPFATFNAPGVAVFASPKHRRRQLRRPRGTVAGDARQRRHGSRPGRRRMLAPP